MKRNWLLIVALLWLIGGFIFNEYKKKQPEPGTPDTPKEEVVEVPLQLDSIVYWGNVYYEGDVYVEKNEIKDPDDPFSEGDVFSFYYVILDIEGKYIKVGYGSELEWARDGENYDSGLPSDYDFIWMRSGRCVILKSESKRFQ